MGVDEDSQFLKELPFNLHSFSFERNHSPQESYSRLEKELNEIRPEVIYAYSMGGRILLSLYKNLSFQAERIFLESSALTSLIGVQREERLKLDKERAKEIKQNFSSFLEKWYQASLWSLSSSERRRLISQKEKALLGQEEFLARVIVEFSPGNFPALGSHSEFDGIDLISENSEFIYFCGEKDSKYSTIAKTLPKERTFTFPSVGHNIHFQDPQNLIKVLKSFL